MTMGILRERNHAAPSTIATHQSGETARYEHPSRAVWVGRILFLLGLMAVAAILGYSAFYCLTEAERALTESQFESIADRALESAMGIAERKRLGTILMAAVVGNEKPLADDWPFVAVRGYEEIARKVIATSSGREMGFAPLVKPLQLADFEAFAYSYYTQSHLPQPFPPGTAESSFGRGVWGVDPNLNTSDNRYHETDGSTYYGSSHKIFAPILQHNEGAHPALMLNLHFQETRGIVIDQMIECSERRAQYTNYSEVECGAITDMLILTSQEVEPGPGALVLQPIYPAFNATKVGSLIARVHTRNRDSLHCQMVGLIASSIVWDEVLENTFADKVSGVDCVLSTDTKAYTYHIHSGVAFIKGEGDLHERVYDRYQRSAILSDEGLFSEGSANYTLSLYPSAKLFEVYGTANPLVATVGTVCIILFTSLLFILYDFFVRQEFSAKGHLLEAKRTFVRFVSHEVRTPLNSVCMGLTLMQEEMTSALGKTASAPHMPRVGIAPTEPLLTQESSPDESSSMVRRQESTTDICKSEVEEWNTLAQEILTNARSAIDVLNDLLNYDKIEMGTLSLELTVIPIWRLIERTVNEFKLPAAKKKIHCGVNFGALMDLDRREKPTVLDKVVTLPSDILDCKGVGDAFRLSQVMRNLISNAIKFTPEHGSITVHTSWASRPRPGESVKEHKFTLSNGEIVSYEPAGVLAIHVTDTGAGMTAEQASKLFRAGVQFNVNALQAGQGSGLGLYIAKGIVEQHNGSLSVTSDGLDKGTTFTLTFPLYIAPESCTSYGGSSETAEQAPLPLKPHEPIPLRVLVVDDAPTNRKLLTRLLQNRGHRCDQAVDGLDAVGAVRKSLNEGYQYDTILLDYEMPEMNGPNACKEIREMGCDSFVVGISGNVLPEDVAHFKSSGANAVLPKPFNFALLEDLWVEYDVVGRVAEP